EPPPGPCPHYTLQGEQSWQLDPANRERFDASALLVTPEGTLFTVNDRGLGLYRIEFQLDNSSARLVLAPNIFTRDQLAPFGRDKSGPYDCEGLARDER